MFNKENLKIKIPLIIYIFLFLFAPPIIKDINLLLILFFFSFIMIITKYRKEIKNIINIKNLKVLCGLLAIYFIYYFIVIGVNFLFTGKLYLYNYVINLYSMLLVFPVVFVCSLHIILYSKKHKITFNDIIKYIIIAGMIQAFITLVALLFPSVKSFLINIMYNNTGEELYLNKYHTERRMFGFANNLLDSFGFGTGIIAALPLFYSINNSKKWLITIPFLLLVPLLNSRTGLIMFGLGFIVWLVYIIKTKSLKRYFNIFVLMGVLIIFSIVAISILSPKTITWIIDDVLSFFTDKKGTADVLFGKNFWKLPSNILNIIFGTGYNIAAYGNMKNILGFTSDVGYINEIWRTGLVGLLLLCGIFSLLIKYIVKKLPNEYKFFSIFIFLASLIGNIKFNVFSYNPGIVVLCIISIYSLLKYTNKNKKQNDLISIVIPVYNVEKYLKRCLDSVINQTYKKLEIILVNDGSTDKSGDICKGYVKKDKRIVYIEQENQGLSGARNTGIDNAHGNYIAFVDSDDYINLNFIEDLYISLIETESDIAVCNYAKVDENDFIDTGKKEVGLQKVYSGISKFYNIYNELETVTTVVWNKLYKIGIFKEIRYPNGKVHEDEFVVYDVMKTCKKIVYTSSSYYYYFQRSDSITGSYNIKRKVILEALKQRLENFKKDNEKILYAYTLYDYYYQLIYQYGMIQTNYKNKNKELKEIYDELIKQKKQVFKNIYINPLKKIKLILKLYYIKISI